MTTRFYVDAEGVYLGGFAGADPPANSIEVPSAPESAQQIWLGEAWSTLRTIPAPVTPRQIRLALTQSGLRGAVEDYVADASQSVKDTWEFSTIIERNNPIIAAGAAELELSDEDIDGLFALAATL